MRPKQSPEERHADKILLKARVKGLGLSMQEFSMLCGLGPTTISEWFHKGRGVPDWAWLAIDGILYRKKKAEVGF